MAATYEFKTQDISDDKERVIVKTIPVPATTQKVEFTLAQKERELAQLKQQLLDIQNQINVVTAEIAEASTALKVV